MLACYDGPWHSFCGLQHRLVGQGNQARQAAECAGELRRWTSCCVSTACWCWTRRTSAASTQTCC